jgi:ABC-type bacteriocin/lantibiotic exporter with double-glycine peptidase domain
MKRIVESFLILFALLSFAVEAYGAPALPRAYLIKNVPLLRQGSAECGPTALAMVLNYYGVKKSKDDLKSELNFNPKRGISPVSIVYFPFSKYDFKGEIVLNSSIDDLRLWISSDRPVIVRQYANRNNKLYSKIGHYRVVVGYDDAKQVVYVNDPERPDVLPISYRDFNEFWDMTDQADNSTKNFMLVIVPAKITETKQANSNPRI